MRHRFERWYPLFGLAALIGIAFGVYRIKPYARHDDAILLGGIATAYALAILVMLIGTKRWSVRGLGLLATMTADALLYGAAAMTGLGWIGAPDKTELDVIRSIFAVGGVLLAIGLIRWLIDETEYRFNGKDARE